MMTPPLILIFFVLFFLYLENKSGLNTGNSRWMKALKYNKFQFLYFQMVSNQSNHWYTEESKVDSKIMSKHPQTMTIPPTCYLKVISWVMYMISAKNVLSSGLQRMSQSSGFTDMHFNINSRESVVGTGMTFYAFWRLLLASCHLVSRWTGLVPVLSIFLTVNLASFQNF